MLSSAGWIAGLLRDQFCKPVHFMLAGCAGSFAGFLSCRLLSPYSDLKTGLFFASLALLLWTMTRLTGHRRDISVAGRILLMLLWLLFVLRIIAAVQAEHEQKRVRCNRNEPLQPSLQMTALLQPDKKDLQVLAISDDREMLKKLGDSPLLKKLTVLSPEYGGVFHQLNIMPEDHDLIILQTPLPDSLYAEKFYRFHFYQLLKDHLEPHGVLVLRLPEEAMHCRKKHILDLYGSAGAVLKQVFPVIKPAGPDSLMLLCGGENVTNSPEELNRRAKRLLPDSAGLPEGVFLMSTQEEIREQEETFRVAVRRSTVMNGQTVRNDLLWKCIRSHPAIDQTGIGMLLDLLRENLLYVLFGLVVLLLIVRYFCSGQVQEKRNWLSMENGMFTGLVLLLLLIPFQQISGWLDMNWHMLFAMLFFSAFCGLLASSGKKHSLLQMKLMFGFTVLVPICALTFLRGQTAEPFIFYLLTAYTGYTAGAICGDIRSEIPAVLLGFALGLVFGSVLYWLPGGMVFAVILAILLRIPPIAAENLQKQFDKCKRKV